MRTSRRMFLEADSTAILIHGVLPNQSSGAPIVDQQSNEVYKPKPLKQSLFEMDGISRKAMEEHFKLYNGYVNKSNETNFAKEDLCLLQLVQKPPHLPCSIQNESNVP
ncbi:MAG: hypothetical protein V1799_20230 [bacterium]